MRPIPFILLFLFAISTALSQVPMLTFDKEWHKQEAVLSNTSEADFIIRLGDVDNLGFGWPEAFDPFCARMTAVHHYPWDANPADLPGFDRILMSSKYNPAKEPPCGGDGYSGSYDKVKTKPVVWVLPAGTLKHATIGNAYLQIFIDDFQAPSFCSKFQLLLNGKRFVEGEKLLNAIDQTGPVGKLITIPLTEDIYSALQASGSLTVLIDETTGSGDGFAVDFIRLLVNRNRENTCKGNLRGKVLCKEDNKPIANAKVFTSENVAVQTDSEGNFEIKDIHAGFEVVGASATGYTDGFGTADIGPGEYNDEITILLEKGKSARFNNRLINTGESVTLNNILFEQGKADIKEAAAGELDKVVAFLQANATAEIELSGHTSSEGQRNMNRSLSYSRVKACRDYIISKGIDEGRVLAIGFGPDRPVASNDTETGRIQNRRVEMRLKKI